MILIAHRGNIIGPNLERENSPSYIQEALEQGFAVEIDVWCEEGKYFLGHDAPQYPIEVDFLRNEKLWCHAKNFEALKKMLCHNIHCFWHQEDSYVLTSKGHIWAYPCKEVGESTICVMPEQCGYDEDELFLCFGICSDYIERYA